MKHEWYERLLGGIHLLLLRSTFWDPLVMGSTFWDPLAMGSTFWDPLFEHI